MLGLCCCARAFSSCREQELFSSCGAWASHCGASLVAEQGLCGARDLVVAKQGLTHPEACGSWTKQGLTHPKACGIFLDQGSDRYPLHCKEDSEPLDHQGNPNAFSFFSYVLFFVGIYLLYNTV